MKHYKKRRLDFLNLFDIILISLAVALVLGVGFFKFGLGDAGPTSQAINVEYMIEIESFLEDKKEVIQPGDRLTEKIKKQDMGQVKSVRFGPSVNPVIDYDEQKTLYSPNPGFLSAEITLEGRGQESETAITLDSGFEVRVGTKVQVQGPNYSGEGYLVGIERGEGS